MGYAITLHRERAAGVLQVTLLKRWNLASICKNAHYHPDQLTSTHERHRHTGVERRRQNSA